MTSFANIPELVLAASLYGLGALGLIILGFTGRIVVNRFIAKREAERIEEHRRSTALHGLPVRYQNTRLSVMRAAKNHEQS